MGIHKAIVGKILKDEKINIFAMTHGIHESGPHRHQIFLCKKREIEEGPFLLYPKKSSPRFEMSSKGVQYSKSVEPTEFNPMFIAFRDSAYQFDIKRSIFQEFHDRGFFDLWEPDAPMKYFEGIERGFLVLFRVFRMEEGIGREWIPTQFIVGRPTISKLVKPAQVIVADPVLSDHAFAEIREEMKQIIERNSGMISVKSYQNEGLGWYDRHKTTGATAKGTNWSRDELAETVEDYFSMLSQEMSGNRYSKTEHRQNLKERLNGRSDSAIERKHQNISAILLKLGLPYIDGYKPLGNYQALLEEGVQDFLSRNPKTAQEMLGFAENAVPMPAVQMPDPQSVLVEPPPRVQKDATPSPKSNPQLPPQFDFAKREANNRSLGRAGEEFAIEFEKNRLKQAGRRDLADKIEWTSETRGHGVGYDVLSFEVNGEHRYIEVKTTKCGREFPFFISRNEVEFSREHSERFCLYRVFNFSQNPRLFMLRGSLEDCCKLTAESYRASF